MIVPIQEEQELLNIKLKRTFNEFAATEQQKYPSHEVLKIDLHCHDLNSDVPDELMGRILNVPETWLSTKKLIEILKKSGSTAFTITNHNNTNSCYQMLEAGIDMLVGTEFSCMVPDFKVGIHVLAYGFDKIQEDKLLKLRKNIYAFQEYARYENIPTVWAHPFYHYTTNQMKSIDFFEKMSLIFERFEIINGQRDTWQNMLIKAWLDTLNPQTIDAYAIKHKIQPRKYCIDPYRKAGTGGSDSHIGLFAGQTGTYLHVPHLEGKLQTQPASKLALQAIRECRFAVYGSHNNYEKLTISLLDYVCQVALFRKDPGLLRILLHKGKAKDKITAFLLSNAFSELQHHKTTMKFIEIFHNSFLGQKPSFIKRMFVPKVYKRIFDEAVKIASIDSHKEIDGGIRQYQHTLDNISKDFHDILCLRLHEKLNKLVAKYESHGMDINRLINQFEIPSEIRAFTGKDNGNGKTQIQTRITKPDLHGFLDGLSFPFLATGLLLGAHFTSAKVLYNNRPVLNLLSEKLDVFKHRKRMLWLTDTYDEHNGISVFIKALHKEIVKHNLPIDILVCSSHIQPDEHLHVVKPLTEFTLPFYNNQSIRLPNFLDIHHLFQKNEYDRLICSTEGPMGLAALYLKNAFTVDAHFVMHTDWLSFAQTSLQIDKPNTNRFRRILRAYYHAFDSVFVLNSEHEKWLTGRKMSLNPKSVHKTAHWAEDYFKPQTPQKEKLFGLPENTPLLLFTGRVSKEKGIKDLEIIFTALKKTIPEVRLVVAGKGPDEAELKKNIPDAIFMGWQTHEKLPDIYSSADMLILPSQFDTFSYVVLEALSCGLPVTAYNAKGPKDIIKHGLNGYLANDIRQMTEYLKIYFSDNQLKENFKKEAVKRAGKYTAVSILKKLLKDVGLSDNKPLKKVDGNDKMRKQCA